MNSDTLVVVECYAGDRGQVENNLPLYLHHKCPVLILSPSDAPVTSVSDPRPHCQWFGKKGWIGEHTLERQRLHFEAMLSFPHNYFFVADADAICLSPRISQYLYDDPHAFWSNEVLDTNPGPSYLPKLALQPPFFFSREILVAMLRGAKSPAASYYGPPVSPEGWPMPYPTFCIDHWLLQVAYGAGVPHKSFPDGASFETASLNGLETMAELVRVHGRIFLHSVKTLPALDRLRVEYKRYCDAHR